MMARAAAPHIRRHYLIGGRHRLGSAAKDDVEYAVGSCPGDGRLPGWGCKLAEDAGNVGVHGAMAEEELRGDLAIRKPFGKEIENLGLASSQAVGRESPADWVQLIRSNQQDLFDEVATGQEPAGRNRRHVGFLAEDGLNAGDQRFWRMDNITGQSDIRRAPLGCPPEACRLFGMS